MFYRGNIQRRKLLKPRSHKKKKRIDQPEWDNTIQDLTVHAASPEEVLRRQLRHKSKNADVARRELVAKKRGIPVDLVLSPGQVELEMKKLAILREVLYDQNDFNEVLKKTDETMSSVKNLFHDSAFRKSGHPNVTLAPHNKKPPIVSVTEQPSKLDLLSDSVMDNKALNEQSSGESEYEDDVQFESKVDYGRFMSLLKNSMNNPENKTITDSVAVTTPEKGPSANNQTALNCTEEVKRTLSRVSPIKDNNETTEGNEQTRKIDEVIVGIRKDAFKLEKQLNSSKTSLTSVHPVPSLTQSNMSYEELQSAMANIQNQLKAFEARTGKTNKEPPAPPNGLASFTVTLIDSVTRLTTYVNEGELRTQALEKTFDQLSKKFDEQVKVNEALAVELVNTQKVIKQDQTKLFSINEELNKCKTTNEDLRSKVSDLEKNFDQLQKDFGELESKLVVTEHTLLENGETLEVVDQEEVKPLPVQSTETIIGDGLVLSNVERKEQDAALKSDMVRLLHALKAENEKTAIQKAHTPDPPFTGIMEGTQEAAKTIASVESHLRHLQLQHAEAQQRMDELTRKAQNRPLGNQSDWNFVAPPSKPGPSSTHSTGSPSLLSDSDNLSNLPHRVPPVSKPVLQQTNVAAYSVEGSQTSTIPSCPPNLRPERMQTIADFPEFESDLGSFKPLEEDLSSEDYQSIMSSVLSSPQMVEQQHAMMNSIQQTQMSLEDRINELNRQHSQAQERLQKLVARRKADKMKEQTTKKVQISVPSAEMLKTPQIHFNAETA